MLMSCVASTAEYARHNYNDATIACEYFIDRNVVKIQPSETLPLLTLILH